MDRKINDTEIKYLLGHLDALYTGVRVHKYLNTDKTSELPSLTIPLSDKPFHKNNTIIINDIPVLFPCTDQKQWYAVDGTGINFHHDILKSAFYLLSGYQEVHSNEKDMYGRFPWKSSIQFSLGITGKPVVNYYFEIILKAFNEFCKLNGLEFKMKTRDAPILFLSHDVDRIKKYTIRNLLYAALQAMGLRSGPGGFADRFRNFGTYFRGLFSFGRDPYWRFEDMTAFEQELHISSTWFFLEKTKMEDSRYKFSKRKIHDLIRDLSLRKHEIGVHGTWQSSEDAPAMKRALRHLTDVCEIPVTGIRQHFLRYKNPVTPKIQIASGFAYDASLGFAEQPGFRNSYSYPFRLYDFDLKAPMDIWQLPLIVMDATLLEHMGSTAESIPQTIEPLLAEVTRFNGVFSLLWHNCRLDEKAYPGINATYKKMLKEIMQWGYLSLTGKQVIDSFHPAGVISP